MTCYVASTKDTNLCCHCFLLNYSKNFKPSKSFTLWLFIDAHWEVIWSALQCHQVNDPALNCITFPFSIELLSLSQLYCSHFLNRITFSSHHQFVDVCMEVTFPSYYCVKQINNSTFREFQSMQGPAWVILFQLQISNPVSAPVNISIKQILYWRNIQMWIRGVGGYLWICCF